MSDEINPQHYKFGDVECIDLAELLSFNDGNAVKYIWRAGLKGSAETDLRKARRYVARAADLDIPWNNDLEEPLNGALSAFVEDGQHTKALIIHAICAGHYYVALVAIDAMLSEMEAAPA